MLHVLVEAERYAIRAYTEICNMTFGKDHRTCEVALATLHEEAEREACFSEYLGEGPSGHFRRRARSVALRPAVYDRGYCLRRIRETSQRRAEGASRQRHASSSNSRESRCRRPAAR
jgi:hypothetical protein